MAIQFLCTACRRPIEVDDDAANQTVTCPYCQKTVTAAAQSDPGVLIQPPSARPGGPNAVAPGAVGFDLPYATPPIPQRPRAGNALGYASLICMVLCIGSMVAMVMIASSALGGLTSTSDPKEIQKLMMQALSDRPALAAAYVASLVGACGGPIAGAIMAIVSLATRRQPRWPGIVSLCLLGLYMLLFCLQLMGAAASVQRTS
jgi:hypothetical protein